MVKSKYGTILNSYGSTNYTISKSFIAEIWLESVVKHKSHSQSPFRGISTCGVWNGDWE